LAEAEVTAMSHEQRVAASAASDPIASRRLAQAQAGRDVTGMSLEQRTEASAGSGTLSGIESRRLALAQAGRDVTAMTQAQRTEASAESSTLGTIARKRLAETAVTAMSHEQRVAASAAGNRSARRRLAHAQAGRDVTTMIQAQRAEASDGSGILSGIASHRLAQAQAGRDVTTMTQAQRTEASAGSSTLGAIARGRLAETAVTAMSEAQRVAASAAGNRRARRRLAFADVRSWTPQMLARAIQEDTYHAAMARGLILQRAVRLMDPTDTAAIYALAIRSDAYTSPEAREYLMELLMDEASAYVTCAQGRDLSLEDRAGAVMVALSRRLASPPPTSPALSSWELLALPPRFRSQDTRRTAVEYHLLWRQRHARGPNGWSPEEWRFCAAMSGKSSGAQLY
jgi:hypothetical protein